VRLAPAAFWNVLALYALAAAATAAVRFLVIEERAVGLTCMAVAPPAWCWGRSVAIWLLQHQVPGLVGLGAALITAVGGRGPWPWLAAGTGGVAVVLYQIELGALAGLLVLLVMLGGRRAPAAAP
jgi:hypothetical protein